MTLLATETQKLSNTFKQETWPDLAFCRLVATANETAAKTYKVGDVVGKITASGKARLAVETAVDGSKVFWGVVMEDKVVPANTDTKVLIAWRGPIVVNKDAIFLDATYDNGTKTGVIYTAMETAGFHLLVD